jgi:hypothetical protein
MAKPMGRLLNDEWGVGAKHALYSEKGTWFHVLERFPGALFDANGYIVFESTRDYESCHYLNRGKELNVPGGIARIPGYVKMRG